MNKELKEKYEKVCCIKDIALSLVKEQISGNIEDVNAEELGEVADIAKDMAELMCYCAEAEYYHAIVDAMEKNSDEENKIQMDKYLPESRYYGEYKYPEEIYKDDDRWDEKYRKRMYYSEMNNYNMRDPMEGKSPISRTSYMNAKNIGSKEMKQQELEKYMNDLTDDVMDMITGLDSTEKNEIKQKLAGLAAKIV